MTMPVDLGCKATKQTKTKIKPCPALVISALTLRSSTKLLIQEKQSDQGQFVNFTELIYYYIKTLSHVAQAIKARCHGTIGIESDC